MTNQQTVVEEGTTHEGHLFPESAEEINQDVDVREQATVTDSIYARSVSAGSDAHIDGSIMAQEEIALTGSRIDGELGTPGEITGDDVWINGSVTGGTVRLSNCYVTGNLVGTNVSIEDSVVVGLVSADRELTVDNSLCYTFHGGMTTTVDNAMVLLPQAVAGESLSIDSPVRVVSLEAMMGVDEQYTDEDGQIYLSLAGRLLDPEFLKQQLEQVETGLMDVLNGEEQHRPADEVLQELGVDTGHLPTDFSGLR